MWANLQFEAKLDKYLRAMVVFRDGVRRIAIDGGSSKDILQLCDQFRDKDLVDLGVQLDDGQGACESGRSAGSHIFDLSPSPSSGQGKADIPAGGALYKLVEPSILRARIEEREAAERAKAAKKEANAAAAEAKRLAALEKGRIPPEEMFKPPNVPEGTYSAWNDSGIPTKDGEGKEVSKSASKGFAKARKAQEVAHGKFLEWQASGAC